MKSFLSDQVVWEEFELFFHIFSDTYFVLAVVLAPINKILLDQSKTDSEVQHLFSQTGSHLTDGRKFEFLFSSRPLLPYRDSYHWKS